EISKHQANMGSAQETVQKITIKGVKNHVRSQKLTCVECSDEKIEHKEDQNVISRTPKEQDTKYQRARLSQEPQRSNESKEFDTHIAKDIIL
ncbi:34362_t:CDS:2, partial [Gigaspora margarita]